MNRVDGCEEEDHTAAHENTSEMDGQTCSEKGPSAVEEKRYFELEGVSRVAQEPSESGYDDETEDPTGIGDHVVDEGSQIQIDRNLVHPVIDHGVSDVASGFGVRSAVNGGGDVKNVNDAFGIGGRPEFGEENLDEGEDPDVNLEGPKDEMKS